MSDFVTNIVSTPSGPEIRGGAVRHVEFDVQEEDLMTFLDRDPGSRRSEAEKIGLIVIDHLSDLEAIRRRRG